MSDPEPTLLLHVLGLSKKFGANQALKQFDFELRSGEIHSLLGENGAGKSTFIKILAGVYHADSGSILHGERDALSEEGREGIAFIHQDLGLVDSLSVAENFALVTGYQGRYGLTNWPAMRALVRRSLDRLDAHVDPDDLVGELRPADKSIVAIARALSLEIDVLVLDEPTATLPYAEAERLFGVLRALRAQGAGIVYVSHRLAEVLDISDRITVMRDGRTVATVAPHEVSERQLGSLIIGHELVASAQVRPETTSDKVVFTAKGLKALRLRPLDLTLKAGEVLGCSGLKGAGHEAIGRLIFGLDSGADSVEVGGRRVRLGDPLSALKAGLVYVTGDRKQGLVPVMTATENLYLNPSLQPGKLRHPGQETARAAAIVTKYGVRPARPEHRIDEFSGGNAQKIAFARALEAKPSVLILDEPTAGIDVGARDELYSLIDAAVGQGMCVLVISTDYDEVVRLCDRVLIFQNGAVTSILEGSEITRNVLAARVMGAA